MSGDEIRPAATSLEQTRTAPGILVRKTKERLRKKKSQGTRPARDRASSQSGRAIQAYS